MFLITLNLLDYPDEEILINPVHIVSITKHVDGGSNLYLTGTWYKIKQTPQEILDLIDNLRNHNGN